MIKGKKKVITLIGFLIIMSIILFLKRNDWINHLERNTNMTESVNKPITGKRAIVIAEKLDGDEGTRCGANDLSTIKTLLKKSGFKNFEIDENLLTSKQTNIDKQNDPLLKKLKIISEADSTLEFLVVYYSGHGGQIKDTSIPKDEDDGYDEYLSMGGYNTLDDDIKEAFYLLENTKILFITDCCHSETNIKVLNIGKNEIERKLVDYEISKPDLLHLASAKDNAKTRCKPGTTNGFLTLHIDKTYRKFSGRLTYRDLCTVLKTRGLICNSYKNDINDISFINQKFLYP
jgi:hypothetical protein